MLHCLRSPALRTIRCPRLMSTLELPTVTRLQATIPPEFNAAHVANTWLSSFTNHITSGDAKSAANMFSDDAFWRDLLAVTSDFRTVRGATSIKHLLDARIPLVKLSNIKIADDSLRLPVLRSPVPDLSLLQFGFDFETDIGKGSAICRLIPSQSGDWKAYTMFSCLDSLKDHPEMVGAQRISSTSPGIWPQLRDRELSFTETKPTVIICGAGHSGLMLAARLKAMGIQSLLIEKENRAGDAWRNRYETLRTHDTVWYNQLPFMPFPRTWPVYCPSVKLGNYLETYADTLELNVWTNSHIKHASFDSNSKTWNVTIKRGDEERVLNTGHLVFATGFGGPPKMVDIKDKAKFRGEVMHSSQFKSAIRSSGKKVVIVGAGNSAHDIAQTFYEHGADVTMYQRSSTFVISAKAVSLMLSAYYNETIPVEVADRLNASLPMPFAKRLHQMVMPHMANTVDKALLDGLAKTNFKTNMGPEGAGLLQLLLRRGGGYYVDTGASQLIIDGRIKVKNGGSISHLTEDGLVFEDGSALPADIIIFATGFGDPRAVVSQICDGGVSERLKPVWGIDEEGELNSAWRESGQERLWFAMGNMMLSRFYSSFLAMRIKAIEEGILPQKY